MRTNSREREIDLLEYECPILIAALEDLMRRNGWSKREIARRTGVFASALTEWWKNRSTPNILTLEQLCAGCEVTLEELWARGRRIVEERRRLDAIREALEEADVSTELRRKLIEIASD